MNTCSVNPLESPNSISLRKNSGLSYCGLGTICGVVTNRVGLSTLMLYSASTVPERNVIEEMCPSPVARKLSTNRREPGGKPVWSGCQTIDGLNSAADSNEYSLVK